VAADVVQGLVQGDRNTVSMTFNYDGAIVSPAVMPPVIRPAPPPVRLLPSPFRDLLDRTEPTGVLMQAVGSKMPAELIGPTGIGKSALLRYLCGQVDVSGFRSGIVYLEQRGQPVQDLLQFLFDAFYDAPPNFTPVGGRLLRYLQAVQALVVIDDAKLERADIDHLRNVAAGCSFVLAGDRAQMTESRAITLTGLPEDSARTLLERNLRRPLAEPEQEAAHEIWTRVNGNPLYLIQAAGLVEQLRTTLVELAPRLQVGGAAALGNDVLASCSPEEKALLATLGALGDAPVAKEQLVAIAGAPAAAASLSSLSDRGLVQSHSPSFTAVANVMAALQEQAGPETLDSVLDWSAHVRDQRELLEAAPVIQHTMELAAAAERWPDVVRLARTVEAALAASGRWGAWKQVLEDALSAARKTGDTAQAGWALHQLGSRSMGLEELGPAREMLTQALAARQSVGDQAGTAATEHNLDTLQLLEATPTVVQDSPPKPGKPPKPAKPPKLGGPPPWGAIIAIPLVILVAALGGAVYALDPGIVGTLLGNSSSTPTPASLPVPAIGQVNPSVLGQGAISKIGFTGTNFETGMTLDLGQGLQAANISVASGSQLLAVVTVAVDAAPGHRTVVFTTSDGRKAVCTDCLTITPAPYIEGIVPKAGGQGGTIRLLVNSLYLTDKTQLTFGSGVVVSRVVIDVPGHQLIGVIAIDAKAPPGPRDVITSNPDGGTATCRACFTVTPAPVIKKSDNAITCPPQVQAIRCVYPGTSVIEYFGSGFTAGTSLQFTTGDVTVDWIKVSNQGDLAVQVTIPYYMPDQKTPTAVGYRPVMVTNPDGGRSQCDTCLYVTFPVIQ
jgi:hypothetical protein